MKKILLCIVSILVVAFCSNAEETKAPDFALKNPDGKVIKLSDFRGKVVVLNFWGTWCPPCRQELPDFVRVYNNYRNKGMEILGIAVNSKESEVKAMIAEYKITYPVCMGDPKVESLYGGIRAVPTTIIIDRKGNIVSRKIGIIREKEFEEILKQLL